MHLLSRRVVSGEDLQVLDDIVDRGGYQACREQVVLLKLPEKSNIRSRKV
jgi:hypothetical protein